MPPTIPKLCWVLPPMPVCDLCWVLPPMPVCDLGPAHHARDAAHVFGVALGLHPVGSHLDHRGGCQL